MPDDSFAVLESFDKQFQLYQQESKPIEKVEKELDYFESFIPEFFSKHGEAKGVRALYESIRSDLENDITKTIRCVDVHKAGNTYQEYLEGMTSFINDIQLSDIPDTESEVSQKFQRQIGLAKESDQGFIRSLFDNSGEEEHIVEMSVSEAVQNLEYLIDFIPALKQYKEKCNEMEEKRMENDSVKAKLISESIDLMQESIGRFSYHTIRNIVETYRNLNDCMFGQETSNAPFVLV